MYSFGIVYYKDCTLMKRSRYLVFLYLFIFLVNDFRKNKVLVRLYDFFYKKVYVLNKICFYFDY